MALDADELAFMRVMIAEPNDSGGWTDDKIQQLASAAVRADDSYDMRLLAATIWEAKAAEAVAMVDVSESGSSRSMGQVHTHAVKMAERYRAPADEGTSAASGRTRTRRIVRE